MKTYTPGKSDVENKWYIIDATDVRLGKLASGIASILMGKKKSTYVPNRFVGDHVIVTNAGSISVSGNKLTDKLYRTHSGYIGNLKTEKLEALLKRKPEKVIEEAVWGMLPQNRLGKELLKKLHVSKDGSHKYEAQKPEVLKLD